jgi:hypothetical protein
MVKVVRMKGGEVKRVRVKMISLKGMARREN